VYACARCARIQLSHTHCSVTAVARTTHCVGPHELIKICIPLRVTRLCSASGRHWRSNVLNMLIAVGQFLCLAALLFALLHVFTKARRARSSRPAERRGPEREPDAQRPRTSLTPASTEPSGPFIRVVPLKQPVVLNTKIDVAPKAAREQRKPVRRRPLANAGDGSRSEERAVLLIKHARRRRRSDRPPVV
jgi:hypothetical protein